ncbi:MAG: TonB family protein [Candidatus Obscuribacter sp.]|nr:TonB family protein [Candidatus Obscuribacter sp.]
MLEFDDGILESKVLQKAREPRLVGLLSSLIYLGATFGPAYAGELEKPIFAKSAMLAQENLSSQAVMDGSCSSVAYRDALKLMQKHRLDLSVLAPSTELKPENARLAELGPLAADCLERLNSGFISSETLIRLRAYQSRLSALGIEAQVLPKRALTEEQLKERCRALNNAGVRALHYRDFSQAYDYLRRALSLNPDYETARHNLALTFNNAALALSEQPEDRELALGLYRTALLFDSQNATIQGNLGSLLKRLGRESADSSVRLSLAEELVQSGDIQGALVEFLESIRLKPDPQVSARAESVATKAGLAKLYRQAIVTPHPPSAASARVGSNTSARVKKAPARKVAEEKVNFGPFMDRVQKLMKSGWHPPRKDRRLRTMVSFDVHKNGRISGIKLGKASGDADADRVAMAVVRSVRLPPLPAGSPEVTIDFVFEYFPEGVVSPVKHKMAEGVESIVNQALKTDAALFLPLLRDELALRNRGVVSSSTGEEQPPSAISGRDSEAATSPDGSLKEREAVRARLIEKLVGTLPGVSVSGENLYLPSPAPSTLSASSCAVRALPPGYPRFPEQVDVAFDLRPIDKAAAAKTSAQNATAPESEWSGVEVVPLELERNTLVGKSDALGAKPSSLELRKELSIMLVQFANYYERNSSKLESMQALRQALYIASENKYAKAKLEKLYRDDGKDPSAVSTRYGAYWCLFEDADRSESIVEADFLASLSRQGEMHALAAFAAFAELDKARGYEHAGSALAAPWYEESELTRRVRVSLHVILGDGLWQRAREMRDSGDKTAFLRDLQAASCEYRKALGYEPTSSRALKGLQEVAAEALHWSPTVNNYLMQGGVQLLTGRKSEAVQSYSTALVLAPRDEKVKQQLDFCVKWNGLP